MWTVGVGSGRRGCEEKGHSYMKERSYSIWRVIPFLEELLLQLVLVFQGCEDRKR